MFERLSLRWPLWPTERIRSATRHGAYFDLLEAFEQEGCPLCRLLRRSVARYLDVLSYENVNDPGVREQLRNARGFCNAHAWQFREDLRDGLGTAIIYRDVLERLLEELGSLLRPGPAMAGPLGWIAREAKPRELARILPQDWCPACASQATMQHVYLATLLIHLDDADFRERYEGSDGLCLPHLLHAIRSACSASAVDALLAGQSRFLHRWRKPTPHADRRAGRPAPPIWHPAQHQVAGMVGGAGVTPLWRSISSNTEAPGPPDDVREEAVHEALAAPGCPLCRLAKSAVDGYLHRLLEEGPTRGDEQRSPEADALCHTHAWRLLELADQERVLALTEPAMDRLQARLEEGRIVYRESASTSSIRVLPWQEPRVARAASRAAAAIAPPADCPSCQARARAEAAYGRLLARVQAEGAGRGPDWAAGLCLPHLRVVLREAADASQMEAVVRMQQASWSALRDQLSEFIRKQDYRFQHEPWGEERNSPWWAVEQLAGVRGIRP